MLLEFSAENFLSFKKAEFSMLAANSVKELEVGPSSSVAMLPGKGERILKAAVIYGANGSGKSNFISSMRFFKYVILNSSRDDSILSQLSDLKFQFDDDSPRSSTRMEMVFSIEDNRYRYGFSLGKSDIETEWLFILPSGRLRESYCFKRKKNDYSINAKFMKGASALREKTRANALFLSTCAQFNISVALEIADWLASKFRVVSGVSDTAIFYTASQMLKNAELKDLIVKFIAQVDPGIKEILISERDTKELPDILITFINEFEKNPYYELDKAKGFSPLEISSKRIRFNKDGSLDSLSLPFEKESLGTQKLLAILGPWLITILAGGVLIIDEFGSSLHTKLALELLKLFQIPANKGGQVVLATHDINLLRKDALRRDQIWFTEKNNFGESSLFSLLEYKEDAAVRNDASYRKDYLAGKYGAIPYLGDIEKFHRDFLADDGAPKS